MKCTIISILAIFLFHLHSNAQSLDQYVYSSAGESMSNGFASLNYSIGELSISTEYANDLVLTQGFHQSMLSVTEVTEIGVDDEIDVFPNPTHEYVVVHFNAVLNEARLIQVYDLLGQEVVSDNISPNMDRIIINLSDLKAGQYILTVSSNSGDLINSYRVVKLN